MGLGSLLSGESDGIKRPLLKLKRFTSNGLKVQRIAIFRPSCRIKAKTFIFDFAWPNTTCLLLSKPAGECCKHFEQRT